MMLLTGWVWLVAAVVLGILELLAPGYIFLGFAIGSAVLGLILTLTGVSLTVPWALFIVAAVSLAAYVALRYFFRKETGQVKTWDTDIND